MLKHKAGGRANALLWQLYCLTLLAFLCRALIPTGFMPDPGALQEGRLSLMLCPAGGAAPSLTTFSGSSPAPAWWTPSPDHSQQIAHTAHSASSDHAEQSGHHQADARMECPFSLLAASVLIPSAATLPALAPVLVQGLSLWVPVSAPAPATAGPPLGSRAPPVRLA